jgi:hypothetical protein
MDPLSPKARHTLVALFSLAVLGAVLLLVGQEERHSAARSLIQVDSEGNTWSLTLRGGQSMATPEQRGKAPGPPLKVGADIQRQGENAYIGLVVTGQAGERYLGGARYNGTMKAPPHFQILTKSGEIVGSGRFEYG